MKKDQQAKQQQSSTKPQDETLDQCQEKLRDVYMNYKDLVHRQKGEKRIFYFKPETFLLQDPEKQRVFREKLLKKITAIPNPQPITYMGDELHKQIIETIQDRSQPPLTRKALASFYKRKHYSLQHKKYKVLLRWAHHALTTEYMERIGHEATFKYGKMEYEMENAMNRCDRLEGDDDYDAALNVQRPNTKAKEGGSLYEPISSLRRDDIEVYLRTVTYEQKIQKLVSKYLARLKWMPLYKRFEIFQDARGEQTIPKNSQDLKEELELIIENYHVSKQKAQNQNKADSLLNSIKNDHDMAPSMIENSIELKLHILDKSLEYGIYGDIELDQGYSFAYQITIFFPTYFQRQIIKSQFSLYDAFAGEEKDQNSIQKRNLQNMVKIDTNIFKDISTTKNNIPSQDSLNIDEGFRSIKVLRLKSCAYWIDYCGVMQPQIPAHIQKQAAFLSINNPIDSLLRSALNFLDVNDLATVNRILEETARLHQAQQKDKFINNSKNKKKKSASGQQSANMKKNQEHHPEKPSMHDDTQNIRDHFTSALKGDIQQDQKDNMKELPNVSINSLRYLPQHMIHAYYILRHMKSRDYKTKILYIMNYFRAIQKRMMLDLREFATRERILGDLVQPIIPATEADKNSQINANASYFKNLNSQELGNNIPSKIVNSVNNMSKDEKPSMFSKIAENDIEKEKQFSIFEDGVIKTENSLVDMKKYKFKGKFNNKVFSTCPSIPRFHATFGEPIEFQPYNVELERIGSIKHATDEGVKLLGRVDHIEVDAKNREVFVKDDFGLYIMYDCSFQDMKDLEEEILKIGSFYIAKHEILINTENEKPYPLIDRLSLMEDLLEMEQHFQFKKVQLIQTYMECYEHISEPLEQQRLMQIIIDLMSLRPRLNLNSTYFRDSYQAEINCLDKHTELLQVIIKNQMLIEKEENKRVHAYLDLTYKIANDQIKGKWTYSDAEDFFEELKKRKATINIMNGMKVEEKINVDEDLNPHITDMNPSQASDQKDDDKDSSATKRFLNKVNENKYGSKFQVQQEPGSNTNKNPGPPQNEELQGGFAAVLGLPPITVESLYMQYKEKDEIILEVMNENANFIRVYEGYPDQHLYLSAQASQKLCLYKFSEWNIPINVLDFFDSLNFCTKFYATIQSIYVELNEVLKPHDPSLATLIETKILERSLVEYQKCKAFLADDLKEYKGAEYIEDETIVGNADKLTFYAKDMVSHLAKCLKPNINPFLISKLDVETINFFDYPQQSKEQNPYLKAPLLLREDMDVSLKIAENHARPSAGSYQRFFPQLKELMRKINIPPMLQIYCNTVELLRLRQELLFAVSESMLLQEVYENQSKMVNRQNFKVIYSDQINFDNYLIDQSKINYIDDGPAKLIDFDLAISEFDQLLKSNLNFRSSDAIKMMMCNSGLEELRAILHYQLMQKQLLIIGVRMNQLLIDTHMRALSELELAKKGFALPNMIVKLPSLISKTGDGFNLESYQRERQKFQSNLVNEAAPVFYYIGTRKAKLRNTVSKKFSVFLTSVASTFGKVECSLRVLRAYKLKLVHSYCKEVLKEAYHDSMKIQAVAACQKLRTLSQVFNIDESILSLGHSSGGIDKPQIFKYEQNDFFENFFCAYNPSYQENQQSSFSKDPYSSNLAFSTENLEIQNYYMIPSTISLMKCEAITYEELSAINTKHPSFDFSGVPDDNDVELSIKKMLPKFRPLASEYPKDDYEKDRISLRYVDFKDSYDYSVTVYSQLFSYYCMIERIFHIKYFITKLASNLVDSLSMEQHVFNGLPFWNLDTETEGMIKSMKADTDKERLSEKILNKIVAEKRARVNLSDDVINLSNMLNLVIKKMQHFIHHKAPDKISQSSVIIPRQRALEFLYSYHEFRYYFLVHTMDKLIDSYHSKGGSKEVRIISEFQQRLIKRDHVKISYRYNSFHSNASLTRPDHFSLESSNIFHYYGNHEEYSDFNTCLMPIVNEHAMSPAQITLFEGIYVNQKMKATQFVGQIPNYPRAYPSLEAGLINLSETERAYVNSSVHSMKGFFKDYLEIIHQEVIENEEAMNVQSLKKVKKFLGELIQAKQLKNALICWLANSTLPTDTKIYQSYLQQYKNDIFWKIMYQKDQLPSVYGHAQQQHQQQQQQKTQQSLELQGKERNKQAEQTMLLNQQLINMQIQVLVDQVQSCKAETIVLSNEIERQIVKSAISAIDQEASALANCFSMNSKMIDMHIHPFQQFASTCYSVVDQNSHLDMVTKVAEVQKFITKLRNRGTEVETLTSGPGMVFTIKDFNECIQILCRGLIKYSEREMRSRSEDLSKKEQHYLTLLYVKDRKIENLEERISNTRDNLDKLINSKMYEKGNQLIYELDLVNRQLRLFKDNIFAMERELRSNIRAEFAETLRRNMRDLDTSVNRFKDFKNDVTTKVKADLAQEQYKIEKILKKKAEEFKNISTTSNSNRDGKLQNRVKFQSTEIVENPASRASNFPTLQELNEMTEREARAELAQMWDIMRKLRIFWKTKEVLTIDKYEKEIFTLKKQQTSNACLWEQLAEAEKREKVLKQELVFTQQSLAASEKVIEKLKDDLRRSESDRIRLNQYKTNKSQRLEELEGKVRKFEVLENINLEKLIDTLGSKEKEIMKLKDLEKNFDQRLHAIEKRKDNEVFNIKGQYQKELVLKRDVLERLEGLRMELRMLEKNEGSMAEVWKTKCKELVEICNNLKNENDQMRTRLVNLSQSMQSQQEYTQELEQQNSKQQSHDNSFQLPKLMPNVNYNKMLNNIQTSKYGTTTGSNTRHSSVAKNESQMIQGSMEKSFLGGATVGNYQDISTTSKPGAKQSAHKRGQSINDSQSQSKLTDMSQNKQLHGNMINSQRFGIKGQQAQITFGKGYQSVRQSQVGVNQFKQNEDMNDFMKKGVTGQMNFKSGVEMTNTTTSYNNNTFLAMNNGNMDSSFNKIMNSKAIGQSSEISKARLNDSRHNESRKVSQDRYGSSALLAGGISSAGSHKKRSNNDIVGFMNSEVPSPMKHSNIFEQNELQEQHPQHTSQYSKEELPLSNDQDNILSAKQSSRETQ
ncbi:UNKNOWN [Stylonychia lemnae]|uniref:Uncharacterized protein n=1 Tax=Stylonychia lemnae TaxID=5949 RepID=A0A078AME6_STYLE|nr:UNKNOWN [Stylonychia lemnae]|eukprot:CDW83349.1 UNKNOWN [Stylonychia lemnae]